MAGPRTLSNGRGWLPREGGGPIKKRRRQGCCRRFNQTSVLTFGLGFGFGFGGGLGLGFGFRCGLGLAAVLGFLASFSCHSVFLSTGSIAVCCLLFLSGCSEAARDE